jgi:hypothetical protein
VATLRPAAFGFEPRVSVDAVRVRPAAADLALFAGLAQRGNHGPLLELPLRSSDVGAHSAAVLASAFHHRPTSACSASQKPPVYFEVEALAARVPEVDALARLRALGFTTLVVHHRPRGPDPPALPLERLGSSRRLTAYALGDP